MSKRVIEVEALVAVAGVDHGEVLDTYPADEADYVLSSDERN